MTDAKECGTIVKENKGKTQLVVVRKTNFDSYSCGIPRSIIKALSLSKGNVLSVTVSKNKNRIVLEKVDIVA